MADRQQFIIEGIAKIDNVLDGIKKIQTGLGGLKVPDNLQKQFENLYKRAIDQGDRAKKALSSGFDTKGSVKEYTLALEGISTIYSQILEKTKGLKVDKDFLNVNFTQLEQANKELERLKGELKAVEDEAKNAKINAQKVFNGVANYYGNTKNYKNPFKEWSEAAEALKKNDIPGVKAALDALEQKFQGKNTDSGPWAKRYEAFQKLQNAFAEYQQKAAAITVTDQQVAAQQQVVNTEIDNATKSLDPLVELMDRAARESKEFADSEGKAAKSTQQLNSELDHFKNRVAYFFGISNAINLFKRSLRSAYNTVKDLDAIMTETAVVTNFSVGDMWTQLPEYTQRANELGVTIHDTYEAATLFYQQGLKTNEVMQISNETLKMARIAGLDAATASDRMTNALRGFNMELDKTSAQRVNDVYSKLAAITASNTDEISTAMTKVASLAHNANMEFETTAAFLAQIIESTRESAETAGTALKTVVARFSEVKKLYSKGELLGQDEEGEEIDVNKVSTALRSAGINLNEYLTGSKGLDDIFIELAEKWDSLDQVQQRYIATMAAGSRQQSRFIALMSDYKRTVQLVEAANNANGASQQQYEKTLESLQTKLARLKNAWNEFILGLANSDAIKGAVDLLTSLITAINNLIKLISNGNAGVKMVTTFFTAFTAFKVGKSLIGKNSVVTNFFAKLVGDSAIVAKGSAAQIATSFYSQLADKITNPTKNTKGNVATDLYNYFNPARTANVGLAQGVTSDAALTNIVNKFNPNTVSNEAIQNFKAEVGPALEQGTLTTNQLNEAIQKTGQSVEVTGRNAEELGLVLTNNNGIINNNVTNLKRLSASFMAIGGIMIAVGDRLEEMEGPAQTLGSIIKGLGAGLMVFGTIMSVYLPLQAQIMAKEVTSAIVQIPIVGWIAGIISAIIALGVAIYSFAKNNSAEEKLKHSTEIAKGAADAANEAREAYEKLNEAFNNLDDKNKAIEEATRGTQEWRDAIKEVNAAVLELMNNYDGIEITRDENGALSITATSKKEVEDRIAEEKARAEAYERVSRIRNYEDENIKRESSLQYTRSGGRNGMAQGDPADELLLKYKDNLEELKIDSKEIEKLLRSTEAAANTVNYDYAEGVKKVLNYIDQYDKNMAAIQSEKTALGAAFLENIDIDDDLKKYANVLLTNDYIDNLINNNKEKYDKDNKGDLQTKVADLFNLTWDQLIDKMPEFKDYKEEDLRYYLAANDALKEVNVQLQTFTGNINNLSDAEKALAASPEGGALTRSQIRELQDESRWDDYFEDFGGEAVFGSQEKFNEWLKGILDTAVDSFDTKQYGEEFSNLLDDIFYYTKDFNLDTYKTLANNLYSVYTTSGVEGVNKVKHSLMGMMSSLEPDEIEDFVKGINNINWASADSLNELDALAEEFGISEEAMVSFKNQIIELGNVSANIDLEKLGSVFDLIKKIQSGEQGRSFTEEDYNNLISHGVDEKDFQYNIETGNYDYIGKSLNDITSLVENYFKTATSQLEKEMASNKAVETLQNNSSLPADESNVEQIKNFLTGYNYVAGKDSLVSADFLQTATEEQIFAKYDEIMNAFAKRSDTQATLDQAYAYNYQTKSGAELAGLATGGDLQATESLKQQIMNSGLSEAIIQALLEDVESGDVGKIASAGGVVDTIKEANNYGISTEDLEAYTTALRTVDDLQGANEATLYALALANANYQEGFKSVIESYDEWIELKQEDGSIRAEDGNAEQLKTFAQLKQDLKQMFNLTEDVSDEFLKLPETAELLERAVDGDTDAVSELRANLAKSQLVELGIDPNSEIFEQVNAVMAEAGTLEFGADLDAAPAMQKLKELMEASGFTVDQMAKIFGAFGWAPEVTMKEVPVTEAMSYGTEGHVEVVDPITGEKTVVTADNIWQHSQDGMVLIPEIGNATFTPPDIPSFTPSTKDSGGGGGGSSEKKPSYWENPYDELYNLQEKINESLRTREALERRYQKLLKQEQATLKDIRKSYYAQINQLSSEAELQKQFAAGRLRQINKLGSELYTDSEGDRSSFSSLGVTKYASYDSNTGLIQIDWEGLEEISNDSDREEEGKAAEAYISKLEELVSSYEEVRDKLWDIEDTIEQLREEAIDSYLSFEDRVMEALVNRYQKQIDSYQAMSDAIEQANNEVLDSLREQIDLSRQIRDNTKKEDEISDMENRLAYLQRDTSGANALEIQKLQKDIEQARESYTDTLVDQAIEKMQNDADLAAEQRARQIETMQAQLDIMQETGALWKEVWGFINAAAEGDGALSPHSELIKLLEESEAFISLSAIGQQKWWENAAEEFHKAWIGKDEAEDKYEVDANGDEIINSSGTSAAIENVSQPATNPWVSSFTSSHSQPEHDEKEEVGVAMNICGPNNGWGNNPERAERLEEKGFDAGRVQSIINDIIRRDWDDSYYREKYGIYDLSDYSYYAFKAGGLADFTGPAWLDGTKTKPELVLNAQDTQNFIALKDILASLLNVQGFANNAPKGGDNYFDIDINAQLEGDYDVDKLTEKIKNDIYNDGQYRNVNTLNYLR